MSHPMPPNGFKSPSVPASSRPTAPPAPAGGTRGLPFPRFLRYIVCGHYHAADTGKRMSEAAALRDLWGIKETYSQCPKCRPPVKRLPRRDDLDAFLHQSEI